MWAAALPGTLPMKCGWCPTLKRCSMTTPCWHWPIRLSLIHISDGEPADNEEELSPAEVQAAVENWRDQILNAISQPGQPPYAPWPENNKSPYYTDKPDWDAFGALLLAAARCV